ncbi:septal ring lytic transglycosylase RlpA family protein [Aquabacterium sp.]|uniref:septal ring lytic transglycosylase RlpA family protein n=1 Tax=Aquabacterium sp. TaxID=1872578 RepID=UPI0025BE9EE4|nr:septal ring lytic transglycosylase RlpA family protein [Aquabacterium sp.]
MCTAVVAATLAFLAGCASKPPGPVGGARPQPPAGTVVTPSTLPPVVARHPDRDGPPLDAPPNLASLPDPEPVVEPIRQGGPNKPYAVLGQSYEPAAADVPFKQRGMASWYGTKFHGRKTASGELYSVYGLTAAHRTLPIPSYARVRSVATGKEVIVRVNDRGPFHSTRVLDLSYAAAVKLGIERGVSEVEIERLTFDDIRSGAWRRGTAVDPDNALAQANTKAGPPVAPASLPMPAVPPIAVALPPIAGEDASMPEASAPGAAADTPRVADVGRAYTQAARGFWVQLAALGRRDGVERLHQRVNDELHTLAPLLAVFQEAAVFKLQIGPYGSREQAQAAARQARSALQLTPVVIERR